MRLGTLTRSTARSLAAPAVAGLHILVAGGRQTGPDTMLNCLSSAIPSRERLVIAPVATADHDVEANAREPHARLAETPLGDPSSDAAEAVRRLSIRRHGVAVAVQRLGG